MFPNVFHHCLKKNCLNNKTKIVLVEKSTTNTRELNAVKDESIENSNSKNVCSITDPGCEACQ